METPSGSEQRLLRAWSLSLPGWECRGAQPWPVKYQAVRLGLFASSQSTVGCQSVTHTSPGPARPSPPLRTERGQAGVQPSAGACPRRGRGWAQLGEGSGLAGFGAVSFGCCGEAGTVPCGLQRVKCGRSQAERREAVVS